MQKVRERIRTLIFHLKAKQRFVILILCREFLSYDDHSKNDNESLKVIQKLETVTSVGGIC